MTCPTSSETSDAASGEGKVTRDRSIALVVEDDRYMARYMSSALEAEGFQVFAVSDGFRALELLGEYPVRVVLLDLGLPNVSGFDVCREIRRHSSVPIIMVTGRITEDDKVLGLDAGADDYLTKPFGTRELLARVRAVLRRVQPPDSTGSVIECGDLRIDLQGRTVSRRDELIPLTPIEFRLLGLLARNQGRVLTPGELLQQVWGPYHVDAVHLLRVNIGRLRKKVEDDPARPRYILTRPGIGYLMPKLAIEAKPSVTN